jgi:hypothetical protein
MDNPILPLTKTPYMVVKLTMVDDQGNEFPRPYVLNEGANTFQCLATYVDGSQSLYSPYWTCPIFYESRPPKTDLWAVLGRQRMPKATIHASANHERYWELACWGFPPDTARPRSGIENPHDGTSLDYSSFSGSDKSATRDAYYQ